METITLEMKQEGLNMNTDLNQFAVALKTWRLRQGLTQGEVGKKFGCSRYTIIRAEGGKKMTWEMSYKLFVKLSDELRKEAL